METNEYISKAAAAFKATDASYIEAAALEELVRITCEAAKAKLPRHPGSGGVAGYSAERVYNNAFTAWGDAKEATDAVLDTFLDTL